MTITERPDTFRKIHKAIRKSIFDSIYQAGRTDFTVAGDVACLMTQFGELVHFLHEHAHNEETYCLPLLEAKKPGASLHDSQEHERIDQMIESLQLQLNAVIDSPVASKNQQGYKFYLALNRFAASYLIHMNEEENDTTAQAYALCSDTELIGMTQQIVAHTSPADAALTYRYMLPALHTTERHSFLADVKAGAPPFVLERMLAIGQTVLTQYDYQQTVEFLNKQEELEVVEL